MTRTGIDSHATGAQNAQLFVHTPVGLAQRHGFDLPQSGDESTEATPHPRDGLSEPNEVQLISLLQNSADPPRMQPSRTSNEMKPQYHYPKGTRRSIKTTTRKTQTPPKRDDARLHETELRPVCWTLLIGIQGQTARDMLRNSSGVRPSSRIWRRLVFQCTMYASGSCLNRSYESNSRPR